ncbi:hypothetical protein [Alloacidobacterium dinghuense]|nr:hypothetical protein [Alloacidobacterium dinghuense]
MNRPAYPISPSSHFGFACAQAYGSEVVAFDGFIPGTEVAGFYP